ncbi:hypothetical protein ACLOJK_014271 [Asimina triloba]
MAKFMGTKEVRVVTTFSRILNPNLLPLLLGRQMDTFFISHGSPTLSIDETIPAWPFLRAWRDKVFEPRPKAILMVSAHWQTADPTVNLVEHNPTIHDFYGFPEQMYQIKYPAPGAPQLAKKVKELLDEAGFKRVKEDRIRGLDHGAWVPLMLMYPEADIPVCQLSVQPKMDGSHHYKMGKALAPLRNEGVLIIGSGSATHNLRAVRFDNGPIFPWALEFDTWLKDALIDGRLVPIITALGVAHDDQEMGHNLKFHSEEQIASYDFCNVLDLARYLFCLIWRNEPGHDDVNHYDERAPHAKKAHPWPDHLYPLHVALGAAGETAKGELLHTSWEEGSLSYSSYRFTNTQN